MKKIMFSDRYDLTKKVLCGQKTQTRRNVKWDILDDKKEESIEDVIRVKVLLDEKQVFVGCDAAGNLICQSVPAFHIGEEVAVAQSYNTIIQETFDKGGEFKGSFSIFKSKGLDNKMFVKGDLMLHRIKITNIRVERLQDISDEDCMKEGVMHYDDVFGTGYMIADPYNNNYRRHCYTTPRKAFAGLIDKTCGKGTWDSNPYVFVYEFELIK